MHEETEYKNVSFVENARRKELVNKENKQILKINWLIEDNWSNEW